MTSSMSKKMDSGELLHLEYPKQHPDGYRYTQFCEIYRRLAQAPRAVDASMSIGGSAADDLRMINYQFLCAQQRTQEEQLMRATKIILVDQDGPLADFELGFFRRWTAAFPGEFSIPPEKRETLKVKDQYPST